MDNITNLTSTVAVFHEKASASEIEAAVGQTPTKSTNRGDLRSSSNGALYERSSAHFEVRSHVEMGSTSAIGESLDLIEAASDPAFLRQSEIWILLGLNDPKFVQVALPSDLAERLSKAGAGLAIENRS